MVICMQILAVFLLQPKAWGRPLQPDLHSTNGSQLPPRRCQTFDVNDDAVTPLLAVDETVLVGSNKHVAKVERATKPGDDVVLVRWLWSNVQHKAKAARDDPDGASLREGRGGGLAGRRAGGGGCGVGKGLWSCNPATI